MVEMGSSRMARMVVQLERLLLESSAQSGGVPALRGTAAVVVAAAAATATATGIAVDHDSSAAPIRALITANGTMSEMKRMK